MYVILKDFAGPVVTLIAASVAGAITFMFARIQVRLAKSQRDIALDKLKFDLFQKRYEIYEATKALLEYVPFVTEIEQCDATKVRSLYVKLDEARFYFPQGICAFLDDIHAHCELFFSHLSMRDQVSVDDAERWGKAGELLASDQAMLRAIYASLPTIFSDSLAFKQLTTSQ
jgi:hypothetical protein